MPYVVKIMFLSKLSTLEFLLQESFCNNASEITPNVFLLPFILWFVLGWVVQNKAILMGLVIHVTVCLLYSSHASVWYY